MRLLPLLALAMLISACSAPEPEGYHLVQTIPVAGGGGWDYVTVDDAARRVYVSHMQQVDVLDADTGALKGTISPLQGVHGVAIAPEAGHGFITNGKSNTVAMFDTDTLQVIKSIPAGRKPDAIIYDPATRRVLAFNGESGSATVLDTSGRKRGTISLGGAPEFPAADGAGHVFVNLEDKSELIMLDPRKLKVLNRWAVAPGESPSSLAIDREHHRLFIGCRNRLFVLMDADDGHVVATLPLGDHVDATAYDAGTGLVISSNGDGTMTVIHEDDPDHYRVIQTVLTPKGSRTFGLDEKTHRLFIPSAAFTPAPPATKENPRPRPTAIPGSFNVLVFGQ